MLCGARVTTSYVRIGGVKHEMLPEGFVGAARERLHPAKIRELLVGLRRAGQPATASSSIA